jgi:hypothetical protein
MAISMTPIEITSPIHLQGLKKGLALMAHDWHQTQRKTADVGEGGRQKDRRPNTEAQRNPDHLTRNFADNAAFHGTKAICGGVPCATARQSGTVRCC